jgi:hypothetical protein
MVRFMRRVLVIALAALALAGCTKPFPGISVVSGTTTKHQAALCWTFDKPSLEPGMCSQDLISDAMNGETVSRIPIAPGQTIGISVDPIVADQGWTPIIGNQPLSQSPLTTLYFRFAYPELQPVPEAGLDLQIVAGSGNDIKGIWSFKLVPAYS